MPEIVLKLEKICKSYLGNMVLKDINLELQKGKIRALLGQNGAGKSTMMKIVSGSETADSGKIILNGKELKKLTPMEANKEGIGIVHQEFAQCLDLTVAQNIFLGKEPLTGAKMVDRKKINEMAKELLLELKIDLDPEATLRNLTVAQQQMVEIAKGVQSNPSILILDEPTAALTLQEVQNLFEFLRHLKARGVSIIYITHRLQEIEQIVDEVTVLRDGSLIGTKNIEDTSMEEIISMMVGKSSSEQFPKREQRDFGEEVLHVENVGLDDRLTNVDISIKQGEIVGLAGLAGCGQKELAEVLYGIRKPTSGTITFAGKKLEANVRRAVENGMGYISESRKKDGLFLMHSIKNNSSIADLKQFERGGLISQRRERRSVKEVVDSIRLKYTSLDMEAQYLSGGNQQKVVIAKWLCKQSQLLIINEPTRGIDVGAKFDIYSLIHDLARQGVAILVISSDFNELLGICDRLYVIRDGRITAEMNNDEITEEMLMLTATREA
ncbi:sugar ABC transporter ATP-binding protein [Christensenellaceae bacterium OttesenSCG-928-K19]|nr:sugar ABC transporter ATP-binding protein [Christensenellaceae bacterium OttesenSCG-928-K19]